MKVLIVRTNGSVVKLDTYNLQEVGIAKALLRKRIQCDIVYFNGKQHSYEQKVNTTYGTITIYWRKGISLFGNGFFFRLKDLLDGYDVIQVCEYDQLLSRHIAFWSKYRSKCIMTHGPYYEKSNKKYNAKIKVIDLLPLPRKQKEKICVFAKSKYAKDFLEKRGFLNVVVTGVGLDIDRFRCNNEANDKISELLMNNSKENMLLYIGQISERRNILFMIEVVAELVRVHSYLKLIIVGKGPEKYVECCKKKIDELGLSDNIIYIEKIDQTQVQYLYQNVKAFLLTTRYEIFGMVLLEAMYFGLPVITTNNGGSSLLIKNENNGLILPFDKTRWCKEINKILEDDSYSKMLGENAAKTIVSEFTWDRIVEKMIPEYLKLTNMNSN